MATPKQATRITTRLDGTVTVHPIALTSMTKKAVLESLGLFNGLPYGDVDRIKVGDGTAIVTLSNDKPEFTYTTHIFTWA